jgi:outer membrane protein OmpA-like peptidoglycan-associated protein
MPPSDSQRDVRTIAVVLVTTILLGGGLVLGISIHKARSGAATVAPTVATPIIETQTTPAMAMVGEDASVVVDSGVVKFYFASGNADLPAGALAALGESIAAAQSGKRLVISGFHDATGDPAFNAELARQRALAVHDMLLSAGVARTDIELKEPEQTTGSGNNAEARRVEVVIAD